METKEEKIKRIIGLEQERQNCDSKEREKQIIEEIKNLRPESFNGNLVVVGGKRGRLWYSYYGHYRCYFGARFHFNYNRNFCYCGLDSVQEWIEEDNEELIEKIGDIETKIYNLQKEINNLNKEKAELTKDFIPYVDPKSFEETNEVDGSAMRLDGSRVYISEAFCQITGERITS